MSFVLLVLAFISQDAAALSTSPGYTGPRSSLAVAGTGQLSCAAAFQPDNDDATFNWVMGFWTGMNAAREAQVGSQTDANGIMVEVKLQCSMHPSSVLFNATLHAYIFFANR